MVKVMLYFLLVALIPTVVVGYLSFWSARAGMEDAVLEELEASRKRAAQAIRDYLLTSMRDLRFLAEAWSVQATFEILSSYQGQGDTTSQQQTIELKSEEYNRIVGEIAPVFERWLALYETDNAYHDLLVIVGSKSGRIFYTQKGLSDLGAQLTEEPVQQTLLPKLWETITQTQKPATVDFGFYPLIEGAAAFLGVPVFYDNKFCGVLALRIGPERIDALMADAGARGSTGDAFIIGQDKLMRSNSRLTKESMLRQEVDSDAARAIIEGKSGTDIVTDYRGTKVLDSWSSVGLNELNALGADFDWGVITKMDAEEAFSSVSHLGYTVFFTAIGIGVIVAVMAFVLAASIARPITAIARQAVKISEGDLHADVRPVKRIDELGSLYSAFRDMVMTLRQQMAAVQEGVEILSTSASEISSTISQVAESASKTSTAVMQTSTTVEQVKQAAKVSSDKAKDVSQTSKLAVEISDSGKRATEDTIQRMHLIKDQMESIGETVVRLSEHSQAIERIMEVVQDLADQSNLLAVNASIEAARAGDRGKGFAVVAHEIKSMADQSKEATNQVRSILEDTRRWVSAVVMATEQGSKAVDAGVQQSVSAGKSIQSLADSVAESSQAAAVINASTAQQFSGVEQVATAMTNIEQAMHHTMEGTNRLEMAAKRLAELGGSLAQLAKYYRVG